MVKNPDCWAIFSLSGKELDPVKITEMTGIKPDYFSSDSHTGDHPGGLWQIYSHLEGSHEPEDFIWDILKKIAPGKEMFKKLCKEYNAILYCSIEYSGPDISGALFTPRLLLILGDLGVQLEIHPWKHES